MSKSKEMKEFTIRVKAGDLLDLLQKSKEEEKHKVRFAQLFFDYNLDKEIVIQLEDKTD